MILCFLRCCFLTFLLPNLSSPIMLFPHRRSRRRRTRVSASRGHSAPLSHSERSCPLSTLIGFSTSSIDLCAECMTCYVFVFCFSRLLFHLYFFQKHVFFYVCICCLPIYECPGLVESLVKKIWALKIHSDTERKKLGLRPKVLNEFFHDYLCWRFKETVGCL
jgi:hypothetical protein